MPATLLKTTAFTGSTSVGGAGTTTGAGANWSDVIGSVWNKSSDTLRKQAGNIYNDFLIDLDNTAILNQQIEWEAVGYNSGTGGLRIISSGVNSQGYFVQFGAGGNDPVVIVKEHSTNGPTTIATSGGNFNQNQSGHNFLYRFKADGTSPTVLTLDIFDLNTDPTASSAVLTVTGNDSTAALQTAGYFGFSGLAEGSGYGVRIGTGRLYDLAGVADLTIADPTLAAKSPTKIGVVGDGASGGNETYGYQWYIHTANNFGAATAVPGATGRRGYVFSGLTASTTYYIWQKVTDTQTIPDTATSNVLTVTTDAGSETDDVYGFIGDSNMTSTVMNEADSYIDAHNSTGVVHFAGSEGSGTHSSDWVPLQTRLDDSIDAFIADLVDDVVSVLGTNDATLPVAAATYGSNTDDMTADLVAHGFRSIICAPPTNGDGSDSSIQTHLIDYQAQLDALDNGTTVLYGGSLLFDRSVADPNTWMDIAHANGIHYSTGGQTLAGDAIGEMVISATNTSTPNTPANLAVVASGAAINVTFDRSTDYADFDPGDLGYNVYKSTDNITYTLLTRIEDTASPSYSDTAVLANTTYYYKVEASSLEFGESALSSEQHTTSNNVPGAPVLSVDDVEPAESAIHVSPEAPASDGGSAIIAYQVYRKRIGIDAAFVLAATILNANLVNGFFDTGTADDDTVDYKVRCYNALGFSAYSAEREVTSQGPHPTGWIADLSGGSGLSLGLGCSL